MMNKFVVMGRLVRDPEMRTTQSGTNVCSFTIACDRDIASKQNSERGTDFFDVVAWRQTAEFVCNYFTKGRMIALVGRLQQRSYTDKENNKRNVIEVVAENVYFADSKKDTNAAGATSSASAASEAPQQSTNQAGAADDDDLPF